MRPLVIVGGGLAGLSLGILLRREGVPVQVWDVTGYPRHRVCGEFISGNGADLLSTLIKVPDLPARQAQTARFFTENGSTGIQSLSKPALCISRWHLDHALAEAFVRGGGELKTKQRWTDSYEQPGIIRATGRRISSAGWTGLKGHARGVPLSADLEMHFSSVGYVGLSRMPHGVNVCALLRPDCDVSAFRTDAKAFFSRLAEDRFRTAEFEPDSLCAVGGISLRPMNAPAECSVGDAIRMIAPFTGNGMSLAVESAFQAVASLTAYSKGELLWPHAVGGVNRNCGKRFRTRFAASAFFQIVAGQGWTRALMLSSLRTVPQMLPLCFRLTR